MTSILPPIPKLVFCVLEPISLVAGALAPVLSPEYFVADQVAHAPIHSLTKNEHILALQLGNLYLLMALIGVGILYSTTEAKVVRNYIIALWIGDIGHLAATGYVLGFQNFVEVSRWNVLTWGNIGATLFLFVSRSAYLAGYLDPDQTTTERGDGRKAE